MPSYVPLDREVPDPWVPPPEPIRVTGVPRKDNTPWHEGVFAGALEVLYAVLVLGVIAFFGFGCFAALAH